MSVSMNWLVDDSLHADAGLSLARMTVERDFTTEAHRHSNCTEVIHLLTGKIDQRCGDDWVPMCAGETIFIPKGVTHQTRNTGDEAAIAIIAYSAGFRIYEAVKDLI